MEAITTEVREDEDQAIDEAAEHRRLLAVDCRVMDEIVVSFERVEPDEDCNDMAAFALLTGVVAAWRGARPRIERASRGEGPGEEAEEKAFDRDQTILCGLAEMARILAKRGMSTAELDLFESVWCARILETLSALGV